MVFLKQFPLKNKQIDTYVVHVSSERYQHKSMPIHINMSKVHFVVLSFVGTGYKSVQYSVSEIKW